MFKSLVLLVGFVAASSAQAKDVTCTNSALRDAVVSAKFFSIDTKGPGVQLSIPTGETSVRVLSGLCTHDKGADELSISCSVIDEMESGFDVRLFSPGGPQLQASVRPYTMQGPGQRATVLDDCK